MKYRSGQSKKEECQLSIHISLYKEYEQIFLNAVFVEYLKRGMTGSYKACLYGYNFCIKLVSTVACSYFVSPLSDTKGVGNVFEV